MVNCVGHPPLAGTSHRLLRPLMLEMNAICLPSGDHVVPPTRRVMYSFSIEKFCKSGTVLLCSFAGPVIAAGDVIVGWAKALRLITMTIADKKVRSIRP